MKITAPVLVSGGYRKNSGELSLLLNPKPRPIQKAPIYYVMLLLISLYFSTGMNLGCNPNMNLIEFESWPI